MVNTQNTITNPMSYNLLRTMLLTENLTSLCPTQILGMVPVELGTSDCRDELSYCNPVFAEQGITNALYNDINSFLFEMQDESDSVTFKIQKYVSDTWTDVVTISDDSYGFFYDLGDFTDFPLYCGLKLEWRYVLSNHGNGRYRLKVESTISGSDCEIYSECFCLNEYSCSGTDRTIRIESYMNGKVGSKDNDFKTFDVCGLNWYDSIRVKGYFGDERPAFEQENVKYSNGEIAQIRDEQIRKYKATIVLAPMYVFQRLNRYALMANEIYVSDYNYTNPDLELKRKTVIAEEAPEPTYYAEQRSRLVTAEYQFSDRFENGIKSNCCG